MKSSLQLKLKSQLNITPQLQQAIRLLKLSAIDLQHEIQQQVEQNPMLESTFDEPYETALSECPLTIEDEFVDYQWSSFYSESSPNLQFNENSYVFESLHCTKFNLRDELRWQLNLSPITTRDRIIADAIIDAINDSGFLTVSLTELHQGLHHQLSSLDLNEIEVVLHQIQSLDPIGCGARNVQEALLIQLAHLPSNTPHLDTLKSIITNDLTPLAQHNYRFLMKHYHLDEHALEQILALIQRLTPRPGQAIPTEQHSYITPDLLVKKVGAHWRVILNAHALPRVNINAQYASLMKRGNNSNENQFLKSNLQEAHWFLKNLKTRHETLLKVAQYIVDYQKDFLEFGEEAMKPLILNKVALALKTHESTISRTTSQKYILTPRGMFELKYFFSNHISTSQGNERSSIAIRAMLKKLISNENPTKPLSDSVLVNKMADVGIRIARRTIAKYRDEMGIPPSNERKSIRSSC